jgi:hypothetical protein
MNLRSFADELGRLPAGRQTLAKMAGPTGSLFGRMGGIGAAAGAGGHGLQYLKSMATGDPADEPQDGILSAMTKGGLGGLAIAALASLFNKKPR